MKDKIVKISLFLISLSLLLSACGDQVSTTEGWIDISPRVGYRAPDFSLNTTDGSAVKLSDLRGKAVFITFWDTSCMYCRFEMPRLQHLHDAYTSQGLVVLGINMQESLSEVVEYAESLHLTFPMLLDRDGKVTRSYLVGSKPHSFFIDENGVIQDIYIGELSTEEMEDRVQLVLK
jgi:cytochrome c biogenesis protein CcmG/thiol:disulfide interchange protein DsbE